MGGGGRVERGERAGSMRRVTLGELQKVTLGIAVYFPACYARKGSQ